MEHHTAVETRGEGLVAHHNPPLTAPESARLWQVNLYYKMLYCVFKHFLSTCDDQDLRLHIEEALSMFEERINRSTEVLTEEGHPVPIGFTDNDLEPESPRLFTDLYYYYYILHMAQIGLQLNSMDLAHTTRKDVREFFTASVSSTMGYYNRFSDLMLEKGIYIRPPAVNIFKETDIVEKQDFLRGFLGKRRPPLELEINHLFSGIRNNVIGGLLATGFQQVAGSEQVRAYMARGTDISRKHADILNSVLQKEKIPAPMHSGVLLLDLTTPPFSDKLMMQHMVILTGIGIGNLANAMATSLRHDLGVSFTRLIGEAANYGEDGLNIMIENGWFEQPPRKIDPRDLAREPVH